MICHGTVTVDLNSLTVKDTAINLSLLDLSPLDAAAFTTCFDTFYITITTATNEQLAIAPDSVLLTCRDFAEAHIFEISNLKEPDENYCWGYLSITNHESVTCSERFQDSVALTNFYRLTNGPYWTNSWDLSLPIDNWYGLKLHDDGSVECLDLDGRVSCFADVTGNGNQLKGFLPNINLPHLRLLSLANNDLSGPIPNFSRMPELEQLNLSRNQIEGQIPDFAFFPILTHLYLGQNQLTGPIPNFSALPMLNRFFAYINMLDSNIPDFTNLPNLTDLALGVNNLTGPIPDFSNCPNLRFLALHDNQLIGGIPDFSNIPALNTLDLNRNPLGGYIPDFSHLPNLVTLYLEDVGLTGAIPNFSNTPEMGFLYLRGNELSELVPDFSNLPTLSFIDVRYNQFTFEDLLPNYFELETLISGNNGNYWLYKQDTIPAVSPVYGNMDDALTIDLIIDDTVSSNLYRWYKDGVFLQEIQGDNALTLSNLQLSDAGIYTCKITNSNIPELNLTTPEILVIVEDPVPAECDAPDLQIGQNDIPSGTYRAANTLESTGSILNGSEVVFTAGQSVHLLPGFHAQVGAQLSVNIEDCVLSNQALTLPAASVFRQMGYSEPTMSLFPNPASWFTNVVYELPGSTSPFRLFITDLNGSVLRVITEEMAIGEGSQQLNINLSTIPTGYYMIHLVTQAQKIQAPIAIIR
ncbi:hypothetical protein CRP01_01845 [Flavilitoribacter nigricans DSM 23189 = NBRC 102662]|uniref:Ig-like domain-containing protein n=1 Tax=Flavilitoribacter nigricans (strain ATCC 23147 / DSM 23189 / NBRC 102662 / NCIMB 1420 / SS-2) TaxID=1122177 RepID=A0A2D0NJR8_FLAN2|nr:hypothetical protein CRP01_01845 [Flavilitoribacter nigricans DSM 23189 = NBRC 102662]